jgi:hypothetical protein
MGGQFARDFAQRHRLAVLETAVLMRKRVTERFENLRALLWNDRVRNEKAAMSTPK